MYSVHAGRFDDETIRNYITKIDNCLKKSGDDDKKFIEELYKKIQSNYLTAVDLKHFEDFIKRGTKSLYSLLKDKKLILLPTLQKEKGLNIGVRELEYNEILNVINKERPEKMFFSNNRTDALALAELKKLNELNSTNKKVFLLISSTERLYDVFMNTKTSIRVDGNKDIIICRDLYYIMLKIYYDFYPEIKSDIEDLIGLVKRLRVIIKKIESGLITRESDLVELLPMFRFHDLITKLENFSITNLFNELSTAAILKDASNQNMYLNMYLFSWDKIPGNDNGILIEYLKQKFGIEWIKTAKIEKIEADRTIRVFTEKNSLSLRLNDEKTKVNLKIDDGRADEFDAKIENSKLNIYQNINKILADLLKSLREFIGDKEGFKKRWEATISSIRSEIEELEKITTESVD